MKEITGICVHDYQPINWEKAAARGHKFAVIDASHGTSSNEDFVEQWNKCIEVGMIPQARHIATHASPNAQACAFLKQLGKVGCARNRKQQMLPPLLSLMLVTPEVAEACDWCEAIHRTTQVRPWIVSSKAFWPASADDPSSARLARYPLVMLEETDPQPVELTPWEDWVAWHNSSNGMGVFKGTEDLLYQYSK